MYIFFQREDRGRSRFVSGRIFRKKEESERNLRNYRATKVERNELKKEKRPVPLFVRVESVVDYARVKRDIQHE